MRRTNETALSTDTGNEPKRVAGLLRASHESGSLMRSLTVFMSEPLGPLMWLTLGGVLLLVGIHNIEGLAGVGLAVLSVLPLVAVVFGGRVTRALFHRDRAGAPIPHPWNSRTYSAATGED